MASKSSAVERFCCGQTLPRCFLRRQIHLQRRRKQEPTKTCPRPVSTRVLLPEGLKLNVEIYPGECIGLGEASGRLIHPQLVFNQDVRWLAGRGSTIVLKVRLLRRRGPTPPDFQPLGSGTTSLIEL
jgi:hypothetical protein